MRHFNADKTQELNKDSLDMELGHLEPSTLTHHIQAVQGQEAQGYFDQANGGVYIETQPYIKAVEEHDEFEDIMVYIPYTQEELAQREAQRLAEQQAKEAEQARLEQERLQREAEEARLAPIRALQERIAEKESYLRSTDYMAIKCSERGLSMQTEYPNEYTQRQTARDEINELRAQLAQLESQEA